MTNRKKYGIKFPMSMIDLHELLSIHTFRKVDMDKFLSEVYAKENSILQLSLFYFGKGRPQKTMVEWTDNLGKHKLECVCKFGVPGSFDQDVYTSCMRIWVRQGMPDASIKLNYSEIARELSLHPPRAFVGKIKKSLERLGQARYQFTQCFIKAGKPGEKNEIIDAHFSLFDTVLLYTHRKGEGQSKRKGLSELFFPDIIRKNLEAKYYQLLEMTWYRALPEGLPRRLYEFLAKKRYQSINGCFTISEEAICRWLPITDKNTTKRRKRLEKIAHNLIEAGYLKAYEYDKWKKLCKYTYAKIGPPPSDQGTTDATKEIAAKESTSGTQEAISWMDSIPNMNQSAIDQIAEDPAFVDKYPHVRAEYERQQDKIDRPAAWIRTAFTKSYQHVPTEKEIKQKEGEKIKNICEANRKAVEENFQQGKCTYNGLKIQIIGDPGMVLENDSVVSWREVDLSLFE